MMQKFIEMRRFCCEFQLSSHDVVLEACDSNYISKKDHEILRLRLKSKTNAMIMGMLKGSSDVLHTWILWVFSLHAHEFHERSVEDEKVT